MTDTTIFQRHRPAILYLAVLIAALLAAPPAAHVWRNLFALAYLQRAGELLPIETVVRRQQAQDAIYGSALFEDEADYKLDLIRARKPQVIALGSSRALQFRQDSFSAPFVNAGRGMNSIKQGTHFVQALLATYRPRIVLLTIDLWWLNSRRDEPDFRPRNLENTGPLVSTFWGYVNEHKLTIPRSLRVILGDRSNPVSARSGIGIAALTRGTGFRPDGSRDYGARYFGVDPSFDDRKFSNSIDRMVKGRSLLAYGNEIDTAEMRALAAIVHDLKAAGADVIGILPPFARPVLDALNRNRSHYGYFAPALAAIKSLPIPIFDFTDPQTIGASDCEFADGLHAGDVAYQRILRHIAQHLNDPAFRSVLSLDTIAKDIETFTGHAVTPTAADGYRSKETDFLGIGCVKS
jgi:hypothetical protein